MRALCAVVVACVAAVAAVGAAAADVGSARQDEPRSPAALALVRAAPSSLEAVASRPVLHATTARPIRARARTSRPALAAAALAAGGALHRPGHAVIALWPPASDRRGEPPVRTGSARGPPIG